MKVLIHLPRQTEAEIEPTVKTDITIKPKFYKRAGLVPIFYFTTVDAHQREERHVLLISAASKQIKVEKLVEVVPACDDKEAHNANSSGSADDEASED